THLDAANNAVGAGRGRDLDAVGVGLLDFGGGGEVDGRRIEAHIDGFDGMRGRAGDHGGRERDQAGQGRHNSPINQTISPGRDGDSIRATGSAVACSQSTSPALLTLVPTLCPFRGPWASGSIRRRRPLKSGGE